MKSFLISDVKSRQILDSRGNPTIEVDVIVEDKIGRFSVPSGASTGIFEALELRDGDKNNFLGKSVLKAVENVNKIIKPNLIGKNVLKQKEIDNLLIDLDGTKNKQNLGANAILGVSVACCKAASECLNIPLYKYLGGDNLQNIIPMPMMNIINGGKHASNNLNIQEFMIMPIKSESFNFAYKMCAEIYHNLKIILKTEGLSTSVGDEGGFAPNLSCDEEAFKYIIKAIEKAGFKPGIDVCLGVDVAGSEMKNEAIKLGKPNCYYFWKTGEIFSRDEMIAYWEELIKKYPIISIEDPLGEEDFDGFKLMTDKLGNKIQIVGDDLFVTHKERLQMGIEKKLANSVLIKLNQIGTLTETIETINLAQKNNFTTIISHRSGETEDTTIADLAVALNCGQIKSGAPCRTDRVCKYNQLLRIEEDLNGCSKYIGKDVLKIK